MKTRKPTPSFPATLRGQGHKATPGRIAILELLEMYERPLSAPEIYEALAKQLDKATVYRALYALVGTGILKKIDFGHRHAHYELVANKPHHHHLVCETCGSIEDIAGCAKNVDRSVLAQSKTFASVEDHSLEFFGTCKKCSTSS